MNAITEMLNRVARTGQPPTAAEIARLVTAIPEDVRAAAQRLITHDAQLIANAAEGGYRDLADDIALRQAQLWARFFEDDEDDPRELAAKVRRPPADLPPRRS